MLCHWTHRSRVELLQPLCDKEGRNHPPAEDGWGGESRKTPRRPPPLQLLTQPVLDLSTFRLEWGDATPLII